MSITLRLTNQLGATIDVTVDEGGPLDLMRELGAHGWSPTQIPAGGIHLPYAMAEAFDWALIGARQFTINDGAGEVVCVEHLGRVYTRRSFDANPKKKMPAAIKYSRGASAMDAAAVVEPVEGEVGKGYVTLATFKGNAPTIGAFTRTAPRTEPKPAPRPAQANPPGDTLDQDLGHRGHVTEAPSTNPLSLLTEGQAKVVLGRAFERGINAATKDGATTLRRMVRGVMGSDAPLDAAHMPQMMARIAEAA
jgi:hypothetical protein